MTSVLDDAPLTDFERRLPTESADVDEIVRGMRAIQAQAAADAKRPLSRGTHAKGICVRAEFEVLDLGHRISDSTLASRLALGIFARPGIYKATVRFANADGGHRPDKVRDVRAMSFAVDYSSAGIPEVPRVDFSMNSATIFP